MRIGEDSLAQGIDRTRAVEERCEARVATAVGRADAAVPASHATGQTIDCGFAILPTCPATRSRSISPVASKG
jgi:hypothetical protein